MATYCVKVTWVKNDQPKNAACIGNDELVQLDASTEAEAIQQAEQDSSDCHEKDLETCHPVGEIEEWCVCGREDDSQPWDLMEDGFRNEEEAVAWLEENAGTLDEQEFYIDWNSNQNPAELYARKEDGSVRFELANGSPAF